MKTRDDLISTYDELAVEYAVRFCGELEHKPFDRDLLRRFAESIKDGTVCDIGCGPGHVAAHLKSLGLNAMGVDISPQMIYEAKRRFPAVEYQTGDFLGLKMEDRALDGIVALYSIIHLKRNELQAAFREMNRVLRPGGLVLVSFHRGSGELHEDEVLDTRLSFDCTLFEPDEVAKVLEETGFSIVETSVRRPYEVEYPTPRVYIVAEKRRGV